MPKPDRMPANARFHARIDKFECVCPNCGHLIFGALDEAHLPKRLMGWNRRRAAARQQPRSRNIWKLVWNPWTQRLKCPWCDHVYTAGLLLYPAAPGSRRPLEPPVDVAQTPYERAEMIRLAGGYLLWKRYKPPMEVNIAVTEGCTCPMGGWIVTCRIHGDPSL